MTSDIATSVVRTGFRHRPCQISGRYFIPGLSLLYLVADILAAARRDLQPSRANGSYRVRTAIPRRKRTFSPDGGIAAQQRSVGWRSFARKAAHDLDQRLPVALEFRGTDA